jgi:beta-glucanase (GH16 family)
MSPLRGLLLGAFAVCAIVAFSAGAASADTPDCGSNTLTTAGGTWQCTFADNFDGTSLDPSKWIAQRSDLSGYLSGPDACFVDSPNNISVSGGTLKLTARKEPAPFNCGGPGGFTTQWTSGMVTTWGGRFNQAYGRFEVRAKAPPAQVKGLQNSFWLWPVDDQKYGSWPGSGEIDIAETYSQYPDLAVPYVHYYPAAPDPNVTNTTCQISNYAAFHTYAVEWTTSTLKFIYDGQTCLVDSWNPASLTKPAPFDQPFFIALTQALGIGTNQFDPATTPLPATTEIDYVHAWQQTGAGTPDPPPPTPTPTPAPTPGAGSGVPELHLGDGAPRRSKRARVASAKRPRATGRRGAGRRR